MFSLHSAKSFSSFKLGTIQFDQSSLNSKLKQIAFGRRGAERKAGNLSRVREEYLKIALRRQSTNRVHQGWDVRFAYPF